MALKVACQRVLPANNIATLGALFCCALQVYGSDVLSEARVIQHPSANTSKHGPLARPFSPPPRLGNGTMEIPHVALDSSCADIVELDIAPTPFAGHARNGVCDNSSR